MPIDNAAIEEGVNGAEMKLVFGQERNLPVMYGCVDKIYVRAILVKRTLSPQGIDFEGQMKGEVQFGRWPNGEAL